MTEGSAKHSIELWTTYRVGVGIIVPVAIVIIGVLGKKVSRGVGGGWIRDDFYAGGELTLAGVTGSIVNLLEFLKTDHATFGALEKKLLGGNVLITLMGFIVYYFILSLRLDYHPESAKSKEKQLVVMAGISNLLGFGVLFAALLMMEP